MILRLEAVEDNPTPENPVVACLRTGESVSSDVAVGLRRTDQTQIAIEYRCSPVADGGKGISGAVLVFRDVT